MFGYIYMNTNLVNGKRYIGQHKASKFEPEKYKGSGVLFNEDLDKYGEENFLFELIEECESREELNEAEKKWIALFDAYESDEFYNLTRGGGGHSAIPWNKGEHQPLHPNSAEALDYGRHLPASHNQRKTLQEYRLNVVVSNDTRKKLSEQQSGRIGIHNDLVRKNTSIRPELFEFYYIQGWQKGHIKEYAVNRVKQREENRIKNNL